MARAILLRKSLVFKKTQEQNKTHAHTQKKHLQQSSVSVTVDFIMVEFSMRYFAV